MITIFCSRSSKYVLFFYFYVPTTFGKTFAYRTLHFSYTSVYFLKFFRFGLKLKIYHY